MLGSVGHSLAGLPPLRPGRTFVATRPGSLSGSRPFVANRNICNFLWYGGVVRGVVGEGLRSVGATSPSKSCRSILPLARHLRAGEVFSGSTPARTSLLKPAAGQQVQPPNDCQGAYHRQR